MKTEFVHCDCLICDNSSLSCIFEIEGRQYLECNYCDLLFCAPITLLSFEEERARYLNHQNSPADAKYVQHLQKLSDQLVPHLPPASKGLDFGCGHTPVLSTVLEKLGFRVDNFDPYFNYPLPSQDIKYDFITCSEVAEHFKNPNEELSRIKSLLNPGGVIGIMTNLRMDNRRTSSWRYLRDPTHCCFYSPRTFEVICERLDLDLLSVCDDVVLLRS